MIYYTESFLVYIILGRHFVLFNNKEMITEYY